MKIKRLFILLLFIISCLFVFPACADKDDKGYAASDLVVKEIPFTYGDDETASADLFNDQPVRLFTDYDDFSTLDFDLDYTKYYFERHDLLVFVIKTCSSYETEFGKLLQKDGKLYPMFYRKDVGDPLTTDIIIMPYCVEISKGADYKPGEIIYCNK